MKVYDRFVIVCVYCRRNCSESMRQAIRGWPGFAIGPEYLRLHGRKDKGKKGGNPVDPGNRLRKQEWRRYADAQSMDLAQSRMFVYPLNHPARFMRGTNRARWQAGDLDKKNN